MTQELPPEDLVPVYPELPPNDTPKHVPLVVTTIREDVIGEAITSMKSSMEVKAKIGSINAAIERIRSTMWWVLGLLLISISISALSLFSVLVTTNATQ